MAAAAPNPAYQAVLPIILCGPSGVGKSTLISRLRAEFPDDFGFSVSHTTRGPRPGEVHGEAYFFTTREEMTAAIGRGEFLEHADVHGNMYGTSFAAVSSVADRGRVCILDIDVQGVQQCRTRSFPVGRYVFVAPPDMASLESRLRGRGTESEDKVQKRLSNAVHELQSAQYMWWDSWVVNDDLDRAYGQLKSIIGKQ